MQPIPSVSVIVPAYKVTPYIRDALESILAQTYKDYEIIVVNDGCPDTESLEEVLSPYHSRIIYFKQNHEGLSSARNTGIRAARAPFIALLDADDIWEPEYLQVQMGVLHMDPTIDVLYPNASIFGNGSHAGRTFMDACPSEGDVTFTSLITQRCNVMVSVTARKDAIIRAGMFDALLHSVEDLDLWLRVVKSGGRIAYHRRPLVRYRRRPGSLSSDTLSMLWHGISVLQKAARTLVLTEEEANVVQSAIGDLQGELNLWQGKQALLDRDFSSAATSFRLANQRLNSRKLEFAILLLKVWPELLLRLFRARRLTPS